MRSFRARIIFFATVVAGLVMLGFAWAGNAAFERAKLDQVEDFLRLALSRPAPPPQVERHWERFGPALLREVETQLGTQCYLAVYSALPEAESAEIGAPGPRFREWGESALFEGDAATRWPAVEGDLASSDGWRAPRRFGPGGLRRGRENGSWRELAFLRFEAEETRGEWLAGIAFHEGYNVALAADLSAVSSDVQLIRRVFAIAFPVALGSLALGIWFLVTRAFLPLRSLTETIESISARRLDARIRVEGAYEEFARLIEPFNAMLERLETSFRQASRFSADAAHELKTPLAILQGQLEQALQEAPDGSGAQRQLASLLEETLRLTGITRKLLLLARADAGRLELKREPVEMKPLLEEVVELMREEDAEARFEWEAAEDVTADCDASLTRQILQNLLGNAVKHRFPAEAATRLSLRRSGSEVWLEVENACRPLPEERRDELFERFTRGDASRSRSTDGAGLGLSLALEFARAQGGTLALVPAGTAERIRFRLRLPLG